MIIHDYCESLGLGHESKGEGKLKNILITKKQIELANNT